ncbi:cell shape determination protein CcmA, partial [Xanthomonas perforans]
EMSAGAQLTGRLIHAATAGATAALPAPEAGRAEPATALQAETADA